MEAEAPVLSDGKGHAAKGGRQPRRPSKETALRGGKADLLAAVGLLVFSSQKRMERPQRVTVTSLRASFGNVSSRRGPPARQLSAPLASAKGGVARPRERMLRFLENNLKYINFSEGRL